MLPDPPVVCAGSFHPLEFEIVIDSYVNKGYVKVQS